jgi:hypothetical protein
MQAASKQRADSKPSTARQAGTKEALRQYVEAFPDGVNVADARQMLASLTAAEEERGRDEAAWVKAQRQNTRTAFSAYLAAHPNGRHAERARARMAGLEALDTKGPAANGVTSAKQGAQTSGLTKSEAPPANVRWPSADEPFIGADGRIR